MPQAGATPTSLRRQMLGPPCIPSLAWMTHPSGAAFSRETIIVGLAIVQRFQGCHPLAIAVYHPTMRSRGRRHARPPRDPWIPPSPPAVRAPSRRGSSKNHRPSPGRGIMSRSSPNPRYHRRPLTDRRQTDVRVRRTRGILPAEPSPHRARDVRTAPTRRRGCGRRRSAGLQGTSTRSLLAERTTRPPSSRRPSRVARPETSRLWVSLAYPQRCTSVGSKPPENGRRGRSRHQAQRVR